MQAFTPQGSGISLFTDPACGTANEVHVAHNPGWPRYDNCHLQKMTSLTYLPTTFLSYYFADQLEERFT